MDPNETMAAKEYMGPGCHDMKEMLQIPFHFIGPDSGLTMPVLGAVMEFLRFGQINLLPLDSINKVVKRQRITTAKEGEIPITEEAETDVYVLGVPTRYASPVNLVCIRDKAREGVPESFNVCIMVEDVIYMRTNPEMSIAIEALNEEDAAWLVKNKIPSSAQLLCDSFNNLLEGNFSMVGGPYSVFETKSDEEGFTDDDAIVAEATTSHPSLFPQFYAELANKEMDEEH